MSKASLGLAGAVMLGGLMASAAWAQAPLQTYAQNASCLIGESETVELASAVAGTLARVDVEEGERVVAGQLIAALESSVEEAAADMAAARAGSDLAERVRNQELTAAEGELARQQSLRDRNVASLQILEQAQTEVDLARLRVEQARFERTVAELEHDRAIAQLRRRQILSPIDGVVTQVLRDAGENVDSRNPVAIVSAVDPLEVEVFLPLDAFPLAVAGRAARIIPQEPIGGAVDTVIEARSPIVDAASGLFRIKLSLPNPENRIPAGIRCTIAFSEG